MKITMGLPDFIYNEMDILFVGIGASLHSKNNGHWFATNLKFWDILYRTGLITEKINDKLKGDVSVFGSTHINYKNWRIGLTNLKQNLDVYPLMDIIENNKISKVCIIHAQVGKAFRSVMPFNSERYGHIGNIKKTKIYEVPSHASAVANKDSYYKTLLD